MFALGLKPDLPAKPKISAPPEIITLAEERLKARYNKEWSKTDALRTEILALGWNVLDTKDPEKPYKLEPVKK